MTHSYQLRLDLVREIIQSSKIRSIACFPNSQSFTRKRKMPLEDLLLCTLSKKGFTTTMELYSYFDTKEENDITLSKQAYFKQRQQLNPRVFEYLNQLYLSHFYASDEPKRWKGYLVFAIDGTKAEVPTSDENKENFGESGRVVRAQVSGILDVLNEFILDIQINSIQTSEIEMAKDNLLALSNLSPEIPKLIIFDRNYPSLEFIDYLENLGLHYLIRLPTNHYLKERSEMRTSDEWLFLSHTQPRLNKLGKKHPERIQRMKEKRRTWTRIIQSTLDDGTQISWMTNLPSSIKKEEIIALYLKRWVIEKKYHSLKNKMKWESMTGKSSLYVYQDLWAQIVVYNMIQDIAHACQEQLEIQSTAYKYPMKINENIAIGLFKAKLIQILLECENQKRIDEFKILENRIIRHVVPKRSLKSQERKPTPTNKYKNNQKSSF